MIELFDALKGEFCIQRIQNGKIIDEYKDHNYIMVPARTSMAEIFVGASKRRISKLKLGTAGYLGDLYTPITEANGFSRTRECLFTDSVKNCNIGQSIKIKTGELINVGGTVYQSKKYGENTYTISSSVLGNSFNVFSDPLYTTEINIPKYTDSVFPGTNNYSGTEDCEVYIKYDPAEPTTVEYTFVLGSSVGNDQYQTRSNFTEACIYVNNRIFCMKCFPAKLKDDSTTLKIVWRIMF